MNLGTMIATALAGVASGRVHPLMAPDEPSYPYVVFSEVARPVINTLRGKSSLVGARFQIDCVALTYIEAHSTAEAVVTAMLAQSHLGSPTSFTATHIGQQDLSEPDLRAYRVMLEFAVWTGGT